MAGNLLDLANSMDALANKIEQEASNLAVRVAIAVVTDLAFNTPVDTTQALSNWQVNIGSPATGTIGPRVPGRFGNTQFASANQTIQAAINVLMNKKPGDAIHITNNLDYIQDLDNGTISRQPGAFVARALIVGRKESKTFKL